ncbi:outer membrane beta-barrel protein [uncultured Tenacibaculum sp.]|uniref:outer membrane beta-barrel protein n=1 Tax=uncultured Tenacibaculum sp. TaxID=174713 RepID=UPI002626BAC5|nr:outer membrane beta-barrel protein [uncultured Tenacibaculum sp.]
MKYLVCAALLISSLLCSGQIREKGDIELTPIIGYSGAYQLDGVLFDASSVTGVQLGVYGSYFFNNRWSLRTGALYQKMGANNVDFPLIPDEYSERTNYITVPVGISYHFGSERNWYINYGFAISFLTNAEGDFNNGVGFVDINDIANSTQFGLGGGLGYKFEISPRFSLLIENYNLIGLTSSTEERQGKNFFISLNIGAVFKL